jgi:hypothetical protein
MTPSAPSASERGIALPLTLFIVILLTVMLASLFARVGIEREMAVGASDAVTALAVAQAGLQRYFGSKTSRPPDGDSVRINVTGGYADVVAHVVQHPADTMSDQLYVVRSTGYVIVPALGAVPQARRTIAQFAYWQTGSIDAVAAWTAANRTDRRSGGTVDISGDDAYGREPAVYGLRTRNGSNVSPPTGISGSPAGYYENGSGSAVASLADIDWQRVTDGHFIPDYYAYRTWDTSYPSMLVRGNLDLTGFVTGGYGLLIVTGDLTIRSTYFIWYGIILVGGKIDFDATGTWVYGNVKSGLNEQLGGAVPPRGYFAGTGRTLTVYYHSYYVERALASLTGFAPVPNGWVDNWATY